MITPRSQCSSIVLVAFVVMLSGPRSVIAQLRGAWKLTESTQTGRDTSLVNKSPQPGLVLFTAQHYSFMFVEGSAPRAPFTDPSRPTDAEKLQAFDTFSGHSGSYTVQDTMLQMTIVVAKNPTMMTTDLRSSFARFAYRIAGDTLWLTRRSPAGAVRMTFLRVE